MSDSILLLSLPRIFHNSELLRVELDVLGNLSMLRYLSDLRMMLELHSELVLISSA